MFNPIRLLALILVFTASSQQSSFPAADETLKHRINGIVRDRSNQRPLSAVKISIEGTQLATISDEQGKFSIANVPIGTYRLKAFLIGYDALSKSDLVVSSGHELFVELELKQLTFELAPVKVKAKAFYKRPEISTSSHTLSGEEIRRSPGGMEDINRVIASMPGVASTSDQKNDLIVRGGNPTENLTLVDNIELPNSNHFADQGSSGGAIGMIDVRLIRESDFYTGGFPARYGDKLSSVLDIRLREGNRTKFEADLNLGMAGVGAILEAPIVKDKSSWIVSYRKSYLELIKDSVGLTAVPNYSDLQGKIVYELSNRNFISIVGIGGVDEINITEGEKDANSQGADWVLFEGKQYAIGVNWKSLFSENGYSIVTLSRAYNQFLIDVRDGNEHGNNSYFNDSWESETTIKGEINYGFNAKNRLSIGASAKFIEFEHDVKIRGWRFWSEQLEKELHVPPKKTHDRVETRKLGGFLHYTASPFSWLSLKFGVRGDNFEYTDAKNWSPRFGMTLKLSDQVSLNGSFGSFYQPPSYILLTNDLENRQLKNFRADHYVIGLERIFSDGLKFVMEFYRKNYSDYAAKEKFESRVRKSNGKGEVNGVDLFLQKKLTKRFYGTMSYSYSIAQAETPLLGKFDWDYDHRHIFTLIGGWKVSDRWEFSGKWRYIGGKPYTPIESESRYEMVPGDWEPIYSKDKNSARLPAYHRLDLRFDRRFNFSRWNLIAYFEVENVYNRQNIWGYRWNRKKGENEEVYQFGFFPVGGFRIEF